MDSVFWRKWTRYENWTSRSQIFTTKIFTKLKLPVSPKSGLLSTVWCPGPSLDRQRASQVTENLQETQNIQTAIFAICRLYARLRGLDESSVDRATNWGLKKLGLAAYADRWRIIKMCRSEFILTFSASQMCGNLFWWQQEETVNCNSPYWKSLDCFLG